MALRPLWEGADALSPNCQGCWHSMKEEEVKKRNGGRSRWNGGWKAGGLHLCQFLVTPVNSLSGCSAAVGRCRRSQPELPRLLALDEHKQFLKRRVEAAKRKEEREAKQASGSAAPEKDYSLKEGQTIHIKVAKKGESKLKKTSRMKEVKKRKAQTMAEEVLPHSIPVPSSALTSRPGLPARRP